MRKPSITPTYALTGLLLVLLALQACSKKDKLDPVVVPTNEDYSIPLGGTYVEHGAIATDNEDGIMDPGLITIDSSGVRNDSVAEFEVLYTITDMAGNVGTGTRYLGVYPSPSQYSGTYDVTEECDDTTLVLNYEVTLAEVPGDSTMMTLSNVHDLGPAETVMLRINGKLRDGMALDDSLPTFEYKGSGALLLGTLDSINFSLSYDLIDTIGVVHCEAVLKRQ